MNKNEILSFIEYPGSLSNSDLPVIDELINQFPYCQTFHLLKSKALSNTKHILFEKTLRYTAAYAANRKVLYFLIHNNQLTKEIIVADSAIPNAQETVEQIQIAPVSEPEIFKDVQTEVEVHNEIVVETELPIFDNSVELKNFETAEVLIESIENNLEDIPNHFFEEEKLIEEPEILGEGIIDDEEIIPEIEIVEVESFDSINITEEEISKVEEEKVEDFSFSDWLKKTAGKEESKSEKKPMIRLDTSEEIRPLIEDEIGELILTNVFNDGYLVNEKIAARKPIGGDEKQGKIIEDFIQSDLPKMIKVKRDDSPVNLENKAKKSANDHQVPVSETLANIYVKQKLYGKAIDAYEKLSLKYPEKKVYFASLIDKIKTEIN